MAISPPGDIVLDVTRAADPAAASEARARLQRMAAGDVPAQAFEAAPPAPVAAPSSGHARSAVPKAYVKFEGMVLQTFLQSMMPDDASVYGEGMSGGMWKSLMAQTLGETMAERGGIGIASRVLGKHYVEGVQIKPMRGVPDADAADRTETENLISAKLIHQMQRRVSDVIGASAETPLFDGATDT